MGSSSDCFSAILNSAIPDFQPQLTIMLQELSIKNFAIIDDLHICFSDGLNILSGETGAGKSVIINAVNLLLGSRADAGFIRTGEDCAELEALIQIMPDAGVKDILRAYDYDISGGLVIRRIISRNNRHKIYLNGRMTTMKMLNSITEHLASISGQHAHQLLLKEEQHLMILDHFGGLMPMREKVQNCFHRITPHVRRLNELTAIKKQQAEKIHLLAFQKNEILEACVSLGEDAELERERAILKNGETLYQAVYTGIEELYSARNAVVERLGEVKKGLERACRIDSELCSKVEDIDSTTFQIEDIVQGLRTYLSNIQIDDSRLEQVETRIDALQKLKRKYGGSLETVLSHLETIETELSGIENISDEIGETEDTLSLLREEMAELALKLSEKRKHVAEILARKVEDELSSLNMSHTRFKILIRPIPAEKDTDFYLITQEGDAFSESGADRVTFLISPNVGESLRPLAQIASGGELSRIVLALKTILAQTGSVETVIFDEVDAGIGGSTAEVVGRKLTSIAAYHQVICITHLPQIAKFGDHHFRISKHVSDGRTRTIIEPLDDDDRVQEIARMLGGVTMTQTTLEHALEMLGNR